MGSASMMVWSMFFGSIGMGFFIYGKKQKALVPFLTGLALFVFPYFISDVYTLVITGTILVAVPYFVRYQI